MIARPGVRLSGAVVVAATLAWTGYANALESSVVAEVSRAMDANRDQLESNPQRMALEFGDDDDWIRTRSDEWSRGRLDWLRDAVGEFNSEEYGALGFNMRDIAELHMPNSKTYVFMDRTSLYGPGIVTEDYVVVEAGDSTHIRPRETLYAIIQGGERELDAWSLAAMLGMSANQGNANQVDFDLRLGITREDQRTLALLTYDLALGRADREQNVARHIVRSDLRVWLSDRWYVEPLSAQLLNDRFQVIRLRATPAVRAGARIVQADRVRWDLGAGLGYEYLNLYRPLAGTKNPQHDGIVPINTWIRFDIAAELDLLITWLTNIAFTSIGNTNHLGTADLVMEVVNILNINLSYIFLRTEEPPTREDGSRPVSNDHQLILGVTLEFG